MVDEQTRNETFKERREFCNYGSEIEWKSAGFTLVEMMVAVLVVATMVAIVMPDLMGAGKTSQTTATQENEEMIKDAILEYQLINHTFPIGNTVAQLDTLVSQQYLSELPVAPTGGNYVISEPDANTVIVTSQ